MLPILLLHGATGTKEQLMPLAHELQHQFNVHQIDFSGHGNNIPDTDDFSITLFSNDVLHYLKEHDIDRIAIFGYSMGGYVGMYLAKHYPAKVSHLVTLATKFEWNPAIAAREIKMLDADTIRAKVPAFASQLEQQHGIAHWPQVLAKTRTLLIQLGENNVLGDADYATITVPCLLLLGDRDRMVTHHETLRIQQLLPGSQLGVLPLTPHPIEQTDPVLLSYLIRRFINP